MNFYRLCCHIHPQSPVGLRGAVAFHKGVELSNRGRENCPLDLMGLIVNQSPFRISLPVALRGAIGVVLVGCVRKPHERWDTLDWRVKQPLWLGLHQSNNLTQLLGIEDGSTRRRCGTSGEAITDVELRPGL